MNDELFTCKLPTNKDGTLVTVYGILKTIPHQNIFEITDYTNDCKVFFTLGTINNFNFSEHLNKKLKVTGTVFPFNNTGERGLIFNTIELCHPNLITQENPSDYYQKKYNLLYDKIKTLKSNLLKNIKSNSNIALSKIFDQNKSLFEQLSIASIQAFDSLSTIIITCIVKQLEQLIKDDLLEQ